MSRCGSRIKGLIRVPDWIPKLFVISSAAEPFTDDPVEVSAEAAPSVEECCVPRMQRFAHRHDQKARLEHLRHPSPISQTHPHAPPNRLIEGQTLWQLLKSCNS